MKSEAEIIQDRDIAIYTARTILANHYFVLDTETTGLHDAQMCQIAILHDSGNQFKSLVKPTIPIEPGASAVHHITDEQVKDSPDAVVVMKAMPMWACCVIYNAPFDLGVIERSLAAHKVVFNKGLITRVFDAMQIYSAFQGTWDDYHGNYKWWKLGVACSQCGLESDEDLHDAMADAIMTDKLIKYIAAQKQSTEQEEHALVEEETDYLDDFPV